MAVCPPPGDQLDNSVRRCFVDEFYFRHVPNLRRDSLVLDLGGQTGRKRGRFDIKNYDLRVICANLSTMKGTGIQADAAQVPFADACFDAVICAELLEHVRDPRFVVSETFRILRENGKLLITVPFLFRIHGDPYDFGRYTGHYWQIALQETGFRDIDIEQHGAFHSVLIDFLKQYLRQVHVPRPFGRITRWVMTKLIVYPLQRWARRHERNPKTWMNPFLSSYTTGFGIVAQK
jgi:SAM-dependent methyltransferase